MPGEFGTNNENEIQAQPGGLLERTQQVATERVAAVDNTTTPEVPKRGLMERVEQVQRNNELKEQNPDAREIVVNTVTRIENVISSIQSIPGEKPEELKRRIGLAVREASVRLVDEHPVKPNPYSEQFK